MKKILIILAGIVAAIAVGSYAWLSYSSEKNLARPTAVALAALEPSDSVAVEEAGDWLIMRPRNEDPEIGLIVYPGAYCDIRGYAPVFREVARAGYLVVGVSMPFHFAIFAPYRADEVRAAFPEIKKWVIAGHSMGGAMAGLYAFDHQDDLAGVIFWDSYPPESSSLAEASLPVVHIHRATLDGQPPEKFDTMRPLFPPGSLWIPVPGGIHMYFGSFDGGAYEEQWEPKISEAAQLEAVSAATLTALKQIQ
jgi:pimeloyl-ACP methyl ester carboxylesterase